MARDKRRPRAEGGGGGGDLVLGNERGRAKGGRLAEAAANGVPRDSVESREATGDTGFRRLNQNPTVEKKEATWPNEEAELGPDLVL